MEETCMIEEASRQGRLNTRMKVVAFIKHDTFLYQTFCLNGRLFCDYVFCIKRGHGCQAWDPCKRRPLCFNPR